METYSFENDITVYCITASSFPAGVSAVYDKLHTLYPPGNGRTYYGISYPDGNGPLVYKAAVSLADKDEIPGQDFEPFIIKKGLYKSKVIYNFMQDVQSIGRLFQQMIATPDIDPGGYCLEMYLNPTDVRCMVKLA
jgi:hypothetical protein